MIGYFKRDFGELDRIVAMTQGEFETHKVDDSIRFVVDLAIEELFTNMVKYNKTTDADIEIRIEGSPQGVEVSLRDFDVDSFDPTRPGDVDVDAPAEMRTPGGLGIFLVMKMVDSVSYEYKDRISTIRFAKGVA